MVNQQLLDQIIEKARPYTARGETASYIPQLQKAEPGLLGICTTEADGGVVLAGDAELPFTIQSISKMLIFTCCLMDNTLERISQTVGLEPTADGFNSIVNLEIKNYNKPLNPMINSGAIASLTLVQGRTPQEKFERILEFARRVSNNSKLDFDESVYLSEKQSGSRNRALAYYMKSTGVIDGDVETLLDAYFRTCAIRMTCVDLANTALVYACNGQAPFQRDPLFSRTIAKTVKAVITLCGMYDESGSIAVDIGLPSKSGVGGGILSIVPGRMGIGIYGPALNAKGSSVAGLMALKLLAQSLDLSIF